MPSPSKKPATTKLNARKVVRSHIVNTKKKHISPTRPEKPEKPVKQQVEQRPVHEALARVVAFEGSKDPEERRALSELRDRAAYVFITGGLPSHLRPETVSLLRLATRLTKGPTALDGQLGMVEILPEVAYVLKLARHPLVKAVQTYVDSGYKIAPLKDPVSRRPYAKIYLYREIDAFKAIKATAVGPDGAVVAGWV